MVTILKAVFTAIGFCCKIVYCILKWLRIRLLVFYLVVSAILQLTVHIFDGREFVFWIGVAVCICFTLLSWFLFFKEKFTRDHVKRERPRAAAPVEEEDFEEEPEEVSRAPKKTNQRVKYYDVAGKPNYVFAEYSDRYELYFKGDGGMTLVRTDYK